MLIHTDYRNQILATLTHFALRNYGVMMTPKRWLSMLLFACLFQETIWHCEWNLEERVVLMVLFAFSTLALTDLIQ